MLGYVLTLVTGIAVGYGGKHLADKYRLRRKEGQQAETPPPTAPTDDEWKGADLEQVVAALGRTEDIMNSRLGFMLVFVGLVSAFATTDSARLGSLVLTWGAVICCVLTLAIWRAQRHHNLYRDVLEILDPKHAINLAARQLASQPWGALRPLDVGPMKSVVGYLLPLFVSLSISLAAICALFHLYPFDRRSEPPSCLCHHSDDAANGDRPPNSPPEP